MENVVNGDLLAFCQDSERLLRFYRSNMDVISPGRIDEISNVFNNQAIALSGIRNIDSTLIHMRIRNILKRLTEFKSVLFECPRHNICPCFFTYIDNVILCLNELRHHCYPYHETRYHR